MKPSVLIATAVAISIAALVLMASEEPTIAQHAPCNPAVQSCG